MIPKANAFVAIVFAAVVGILVGVIVPHILAGGNDDNPVGFRAREHQQAQHAQPLPSPGSRVAQTFSATRIVPNAKCFTLNIPCSVSIDLLQLDSSLPACEDGDGSPPCKLLACPAFAACLQFSGNFDVQHVRKDGAHTKESMPLQGIVIVQ